jgi:hypothetical protein
MMMLLLLHILYPELVVVSLPIPSPQNQNEASTVLKFSLLLKKATTMTHFAHCPPHTYT